jgi:hypothetical protein
MVLFINDRSLGEHADLVAALRLFKDVLTEIRQAGVTCSLHRDCNHFLSPSFKQRFNNLPLPCDIRAILRELVFSDKHFPCWRPARRSDAATIYECAAPEMMLADETTAEAAERTVDAAETPVVLLSAADSNFAGLDSLAITRNGESLQPFIALSVERIQRHLAEIFGQYDTNTKTAPRDFQTVLGKDAYRFVYTGKVERRLGRRVYIERPTGRYFYVDEGHPGPTAHLEVFSSIFAHLGTADVNTGALNPAARVAGRWLRF